MEKVIVEDEPIVARARAGRHAVYGQTAAGHYIVIFVEAVRTGRMRQPRIYRPVTAREMTGAEQQRYQDLT
ncbi:MAG: hypothetical protein HYY00_02705 [Chloroflexi bacterium]|nr:hypothetical protein [Chloroflexota bacterium]